jgi:hypothetical protein
VKNRQNRKDNPIDQLINELIESPIELVELTLFFVVIALLLAELGQNEMLSPLKEIFDMFLLASDVAFYILLIGAILYLYHLYEDNKNRYRGI